MGEVLSTLTTGKAAISPVSRYCVECGWATANPKSKCPRCGRSKYQGFRARQLSRPGSLTDFVDPSDHGDPSSQIPDKLSKNHTPPPLSPPAQKEDGDPRNRNEKPRTSHDELEKKDVTGNEESSPHKQKLMNVVNRRSRAYSRQFVEKVAQKVNEATQDTIDEEGPEAGLTSVRPVVRKIVDLTPQYKTEDGSEDGVLVVDAIERILIKEKLKGTKCLEIADEVYMELIINETNGYNFVAALLNVYELPFFEFGLFLATPPDEGTMSLLEEAVCQESLDLFYEVLKMGADSVLKGVLSCKDLPEEVRQEVLDLMNDAASQYH